MLVINSSEKIILSLENIFDTLTSLEKIGQVIDMPLDNPSAFSTLDHNITEPIQVDISELSFIYPGRTKSVLKDINYTFEAGKSYCISGNNGAGKSTLLHLISGLYEPQSGSVCINGYPIGNYNIAELYQHIGNGLIEESIFEGTLYENIALGRAFVSAENVNWAIDRVFLKEYVQSLPRGLDSPLEISGQKLSKSVIQRIIIARSIVHKPKLLLLENHIDCIEDDRRNKIIQFLTDKKNGWTLITISEDQYLKKHSDIILNMKNGIIVNN